MISLCSCLFLYPRLLDSPSSLSRDYLPELARVRAQREATLQKHKTDSTARMLADLAVDRAHNPRLSAQDRWNADEEEGEEEDDGGELNIIDRSTSIISFINWHRAFPPAFLMSRHSLSRILKEFPAACCVIGVEVALYYPLLSHLLAPRLI
jgi:hypothetical protein